MSPTLSRQLREDRERQAWRMRQRGMTYREIGSELGVHYATVKRAIQRVEKELAKRFEDEARAVKIEQSNRLEFIADEALAEWERSKQPAEITRTVRKRVMPKERPEKAKPAEDPFSEEPLPPELEVLWQDLEAEIGEDALLTVEETTTTETRGQCGNPAFLAQAREALADQRAIWGLDAPKKTDVTSDGKALNTTGLPIALLELGSLDADEIRRRIDDARAAVAAGDLPDPA